ncbi:NTP transferase domain-containing protein [Eubacteriales bacterium OttesenSCG-928-G02]|nr:NTP transferase domain-containing protein [Eubacteriales bacterium OttesenSCG-928-G02]
MTLVILAAGMASRYGGDKQLEAVGPNGELILDYSVFDAKEAGFNKILLLIKKENQKAFHEKVGKRFEDKIQIDYAFQDLTKYTSSISYPKERIKPWGTGHALLCCKDHVKENFAVINADDFYGKNTYKLLFKHLSACKKNELAMVGYKLKNTVSEHGTVSRGICYTDSQSYLEKITEITNIKSENGKIGYYNNSFTELSPDAIVSMNAFGLTPDFFTNLEEGFYKLLKENSDLLKCEYYLPAAIQNSMVNCSSTVKVYESEDLWYGVTYKEDKEFVCKGIENLINNGSYPEKLY